MAHVQPYAMHWPETEMHAAILACRPPAHTHTHTHTHKQSKWVRESEREG